MLAATTQSEGTKHVCTVAQNEFESNVTFTDVKQNTFIPLSKKTITPNEGQCINMFNRRVYSYYDER